MLTPHDDSLWHQLASTFDHVGTSDPRFYDRLWFAATDPGGAGTLQFTLGVYQNMNVVDGGFVVIRDAEQHNLRASRELRPDFSARCHPLQVEVLEPLRVLHLAIAPNDSGLDGDLTWTATSPPQEERPHHSRVHGRVVEDYVRYDQTGTLSGTLTVAGEHLTVDRWWACRDHSWGVRPGIGIPEPFTGARPRHDRFVFAFLFFSTDEQSGHVQLTRRGEAGHMTAALLDHGRGTETTAASVELRATFVDTERPRRVAGATFSVVGGDGAATTIAVEPLGPAVAMTGLGYGGFDDGRGLGAHRGVEHVEHDVWDVGHPAVVGLPDGTTTRPLHRIQPVRVTASDGTRTSTGVGSLTMIAEDDLGDDGSLVVVATSS